MTPTLCKSIEWRSVRLLLNGSRMPNVTDAERQDILLQIVPTRIRNVKILGHRKVDSKENQEEGLIHGTKGKARRVRTLKADDEEGESENDTSEEETDENDEDDERICIIQQLAKELPRSARRKLKKQGF